MGDTMRKVCLILCVFLLMIGLVSAQTPRNGTDSEGKSNFSNLAVTGLNATGVPGYIEMTSALGNVMYLYLDNNSILRVASDVQIGNSTASPRTSNWSILGDVVGSQS